MERRDENITSARPTMCRHCNKKISKRYLKGHQEKCDAASISLPQGYRVEKEKHITYSCSCGYKSRRSRIFHHILKYHSSGLKPQINDFLFSQVNKEKTQARTEEKQVKIQEQKQHEHQQEYQVEENQIKIEESSIKSLEELGVEPNSHLKEAIHQFIYQQQCSLQKLWALSLKIC